jgi:hypothetical protein
MRLIKIKKECYTNQEVKGVMFLVYKYFRGGGTSKNPLGRIVSENENQGTSQ